MQPRILPSGHPRHIIQRGNNRDIIFVDSLDHRFYLKTPAACCSRFGCAVHAYVCMTNHVNLLATAVTDTVVSRVMQALGRKYARYFNFLYRHAGTLWEGRFKASPVEVVPSVLRGMTP